MPARDEDVVPLPFQADGTAGHLLLLLGLPGRCTVLSVVRRRLHLRCWRRSWILFSAVFSVILLGKHLSLNQWISLLILSTGVICVQARTDGVNRTDGVICASYSPQRF